MLWLEKLLGFTPLLINLSLLGILLFLLYGWGGPIKCVNKRDSFLDITFPLTLTCTGTHGCNTCHVCNELIPPSLINYIFITFKPSNVSLLCSDNIYYSSTALFFLTKLLFHYGYFLYFPILTLKIMFT